MSSDVTHYQTDWPERWEQPNGIWTHDLWYSRYCWLCREELAESE